MRSGSLARIFVIALTLALAAGAAATAQEEEKAQPKKKKPMLNPPPQTQTAPAQGAPADKGKKPGVDKGKGTAPEPPRDPREAGWLTVQGRIVSVHPEKKAIIIKTDIKEHEVFVNSQTQITRDGQPVEIKALEVNDKVDACHFNAKHWAQSLKVTSAAKNLTPNPKPARQEAPPTPTP